MKKILISVLTIALVGVAAFGASRAFFSDTETSKNNEFEAGDIDLTVTRTQPGKVDAILDGNDLAFFDVEDLKPGDKADGRISLKAESNNYWACAMPKLTANEENLLIDPEAEAGDTTENVGELDKYLNFYFWVDTTQDGLVGLGETLYGPYKVNDATGWISLADFAGGLFGNTALTPSVGHEFAYIYCFGTIEDGGCSGVGDQNDAQTDRLVGDLEFYAVQERNNEEFTCESMNPYFNLTDPSEQNALNAGSHTYPWYTYEIHGLSIDFVLHNPNSWPAYFDFAIDGEAGTYVDGESNVTAHEGPFNGQLLGDQYTAVTVPPLGSVNVTKTGTNEIRVGIHYGAEQHSYLDWATFTAVYP